MPKTKISEFSATPGNNTDIDGINIAEGCAPSGINDAIRELMAQLKDFQAGTAGDSFNGPVGTTTAAAGAFTTLTTSSTVTHNGGTANGVAYLNGSKVLTTGSALTFDGTNLLQATGGAAAVFRVGSTVSSGRASTINLGNNAGVARATIALDAGTELMTIGSEGNFPVMFQVNGSEQARLTSTGLGIGTSSPGVKLDVYSSSTTAARVEGGTGAGLGAYMAFKAQGANSGYIGTQSGITGGGTSNNLALYAASTNSITLWTNGTQNATLDSSGNLGVGTSSPAEKLQVNGTAALFNNTAGTFDLKLYQTDRYDGRITVNSSGFEISQRQALPLLFLTSDTERARIDSSGNLGVGTTSIGERLVVNGNASVDVYKLRSNTATPASTDSFIYRPADNTLAFGTASAERARITSGGDFGIGTTSPTNSAGYSTVSINGSTGGQLVFQTGGVYKQTIYSTSTDLNILNSQAGVLTFATNAAERARITSGGALLVGATSAVASELFLVRTTASAYVSRLANDSTTAANCFGQFLWYSGAAPNGTGNQFLRCDDSAATRAEIRSNGGLANYSANDVNLSDRREKTNFAPAKSYLDTICAIPVQTFNYIDQSEDDPGLTLGVVAQDVQAVAPELVMESNWGTADNPKMRLSVYQTDLQYALMKCIQEQQAMINELKAKVAALEAK